MKYPVNITRDGNSFMASFPDIPEALTGGDTYEETLAAAQDALVTAFEFYFEDMRSIPLPSNEGATFIEVPLSIWAKVLLLNQMVADKVTQYDLAKRMGTTKQELQRITDFNHSTKIDTLEKALLAMGKNFQLSIA